MDKAPDAFRTISEVAEVLETPAHVLRFWESRFPQIKPVKRAGGRRYYRPADVALLSGIRQLLHTEGMTIRGVQKVLREQGVRHVASLAGDVDALDLDADIELEALPTPPAPAPVAASPVVVALPRRSPDPVATQAAIDAAPAAAAPVASLFPDAPRSAPPEVPREGEGGFIAFSPPRSPRPRAVNPPQQPSLPFDTEAPHIWVETDVIEPAEVTRLITPSAAPEVPELAGLSARLRALPQPLSAAAATALAKAHSRLGLLQAQMAEAQRLRRPTV